MTWKRVSQLLVLLLAVLMIGIFLQVDWPVADPDDTTNEQLGHRLFGDAEDPGYSPVLLMIALVLTVALLGAVFLAKEEERE